MKLKIFKKKSAGDGSASPGNAAGGGAAGAATAPPPRSPFPNQPQAPAPAAKPPPGPDPLAPVPPSPADRSDRSGEGRERGEKKKKKHKDKDRKKSHKKSHKSRRDDDDGDDNDDDDENAEPRMLVGLGTRRKSEIEIDVTGLKIADPNGAPGAPATGPGRGISRRDSNHNIACNESSVVGNFMQNIHASPLVATAHYEAPVYPKSEEDADFISVSLQRNFVFANALSDEDTSRKREMKRIVDAFERHTVRQKGVTILSAGEVGDYFYILREGCVEYRDPQSRKQVGRAKRPGQSFGELCLLYDCPPPADCVSADPSQGNVQPADGSSCDLWRLHKLTFRQIMAMRTMKRDEKLRDAIRKVEEFGGLDDEFVNRIANALDVRTVKRGEEVYRRGDPADEFFVVGSEGRIELSSGATLGSGDAFGTSGIAGKDPRSETAVAEKRTTLLVMSREHLDRTVGSLKDAIRLSQERKLLKSIPLFRDSDFEDYEYELLAALIEDANFQGGSLVYKEDDIVDEPALMIVREGVLEVFSERHPDRERVLKPGDYFGEDSLTPDKNMKFGGAKGGTKYREDEVEAVSEEVVCGKLTLADIDSVVSDLHRLGCKRRGTRKGGGSSKSRRDRGGESDEPRPEGLDEIDFHRLFGAGTFGRVWIVTRTGGKTAYALKIQSKRELLDQRQASSARRERAVMAKLDHPFACRLVNTFQDDACIYMLLSLIQGGELLNLIQGGEVHEGLPEIATKFYAAGILEGLTYMHRRHIVYRDLKPENVLLDADGYPVIVDFGFSKVVNDKTYTFCGTPLYLAPEIVLSRGKSSHSYFHGAMSEGASIAPCDMDGVKSSMSERNLGSDEKALDGAESGVAVIFCAAAWGAVRLGWAGQKFQLEWSQKVRFCLFETSPPGLTLVALQNTGHDRAVDYWSLGCLIFEMLFAATPFYERGIDQKGLFKNIVRGKWRIPSRGSRLSSHASELLRGMLQKRPAERLGCLAGGYRDVKSHRFFREVNFAKLVKKQIKAPWVPHIEDPLDISHFENFDAEDQMDFTKGKKPLTADEQIVFQDF
ncbi:hypothetical protein ACHAWF_006882 [Thalassiosira exigua]